MTVLGSGKTKKAAAKTAEKEEAHWMVGVGSMGLDHYWINQCNLEELVQC